SYVWFVFFFFFQAEDGIRDRTVTGVQTCALPISTGPRGAARKFCRSAPAAVSTARPPSRWSDETTCWRVSAPGPPAPADRCQWRSEERRAGKPSTSRPAPPPPPPPTPHPSPPLHP